MPAALPLHLPRAPAPLARRGGGARPHPARRPHPRPPPATPVTAVAEPEAASTSEAVAAPSTSTTAMTPPSPAVEVLTGSDANSGAAAALLPDGPPGDGSVLDADSIIGVRVVPGVPGGDEVAARPKPEYLVKWKDESLPPTWEPPGNIADNLLRDYEDRWWRAAREGDAGAMRAMLAGGPRVLSNVVDDARRSALHFAAGKGSAECVELLCRAGAALDLTDKEGFTPLHMAVGYSHSPVVAALLDAGADPTVPDRQGRDVVALVSSLRASTPMAPELMGRRFALEQAASLLSDALFEEVEPRAVLADRPAPPGAGGREFLVSWPDGRPDAWVPARDVAADVVADYDAGLEYADAASIRADRRKGTDGVEYLVRWADGGGGEEGGGGALETWEPEENVEAGLVAAYEAAVKARAAELAGGGGKKAA